MPSPEPDPNGAPARPPRAPAGERRRQILAAAREVSLERGLAAVRMEQIAARARVSKGTLYNHFESKEDLLLAMLEDRLALGTEIVARAVGTEPDPARALERTLDGLVQLIGVQAQTTSLLYQAWALVADAPPLQQRLEEALRRFFQLWARSTHQNLQVGQAAGAFRADADAEAFSAALLALVSGFIFRGAFDPGAIEPAALRAAFQALVADQLLAEPAARSGGPR